MIEPTMTWCPSIKKIVALQRQNAIKWAQRALFLWVQDEDNNYGFFHNCVRIRKHFNTISHIMDASGRVFTDRHGIEQFF